MTTTSELRATRRIRPWIAALLTFLGWGLGLYYARRTRLALWAAAISIVFTLVLGVGVFGYIIATDSVPAWFVPSEGWSILETVDIALSALAATIVWMLAAQHQQVKPATSARLWGYMAIWLLPLLISLILAMSLRFAVMQPFRIPSGSMQPTLHVGDYILVEKWSYGYSRFSAAPLHSLLPQGRLYPREPQRGDIAVYRPTPIPERDFVSRIVGLPGDRLQMIGGELHINGASVARQDLGAVEFAYEDGFTETIQAWRETLSNGVSYTTFDRNPSSELDNTRVYVVPDGHYFMMGDDRDNAADSRVPSVVGYVPLDNFVGRVDHIIRPGPGRGGPPASP